MIMLDVKTIKKLVSETGISETKTAENLGITRACWRNYLEGRTIPKIDVVIKMANYFAVPMDVLCGLCTEAEYNAIMQNYSANFMKLRRAPYEAYLLGRTKCDKIPDGYESPWPYNLYEVVCGEPIECILTDDQLCGLDKAIAYLTDKQQTVIFGRYRDGHTLDEMAAELDITRERVRQIEAKAIRILRHPAHQKIMFYGLVKVESALEQQRRVDAAVFKLTEITNVLTKGVSVQTDDICVLPIEDLDLSVRAYNCLKRAGYKTVGSLIDAFEDDMKNENCSAYFLLKIRNLGPKGICEIILKMNEWFPTLEYGDKYSAVLERLRKKSTVSEDNNND